MQIPKSVDAPAPQSNLCICGFLIHDSTKGGSCIRFAIHEAVEFAGVEFADMQGIANLYFI